MEPTIALLQEILARLGYLMVAFDQNTLDAPTLAALQRFQQIHAIEPSGAADERTWEQLRAAAERGECIVSGQVVDQFGPLARAIVVVQDRELGDQANWPILGAEPTGPDGSFVIAYSLEQVLPGDRRLRQREATADLIVDLRELTVESEGFTIERLPGGERVSDDERALGIQARRVEELRIVVNTLARRWREGASEFERLLAAFQAVWPEVSPATLDDARREPEFVARELEVQPGMIDALVGAFRMHERAFDLSVSAAILYGLARCDQHLTDIASLALARSGQLKAGIFQAVERLIIPPQPDEEIDRAISQIRQLAPEQALAGANGPGYAAVLGNALLDNAQQTMLLRAAAGRQADPQALWDGLRANPQFAEPGMLEQAQFALQLDALTSRHLPLMAVLQRERGLASTRALLDLDPAELRAIIARPEVGVPEGTPGENLEQQADAYVSGLVGQLHHAFPTETIARAIADAPAEALGGEATRLALGAVLANATSEAMRVGGTAFDIRTTHIDSYLAAHSDAVLAEVAEAARPQVIAGLMRAQRLYRVSTGKESFDWLLKSGYGSAFDIAQSPQQTFVSQASAVLGEHQAHMIHSRASVASDTALSIYVQLNDAIFGIYPAGVLDGRDRVEAAAAIEQAVVKYLPSWSALFGQVSWCDCAHCRSVYSPAAYLVDLLNFLDKSARNAQGQSPLDVLLARRPDIAQLKLSCENTNTLIPYVDLINEVLESLVVSLDPLKIPSFDTAGATAAEQQAAPQYTNWEAYSTPSLPEARPRLERAVYPAGLPFDAPLLATRTYLEHLKVRRADLIAVVEGGSLTNVLAAERLGLSPALFAIITGVNLDETPTDLAASLDDRYGWSLQLPPDLALGASGALVWVLKHKLNRSGAALAVGDDLHAEGFDAATEAAVQVFQISQGVPATGSVDADTWKVLLPLDPPIALAFLPHGPMFLERSGLTFEALLDLLKMRFVNPEQQTFAIVRTLGLPGADLLAFVQADLQNPNPALLAALQTAGVSEEDFTAWAQTHLAGEAWDRFRMSILPYGPTDQSCDLSALTIRHWDNAAPALAADEWLQLDRLTRLWRALGWSLDDLDLALTALAVTAINAPVVRALAQIAELARQLDLSIPQVVAFWADLDPTRPGGLYAKRFLSRALLGADSAFEPDWAGRVLLGAVVAEHLPALQAGLRASGADLAALRAQLGLADDRVLDQAVLSNLFRYITLTRALQFNVRDLIRMLNLSGLDPFQVPGDDWPALTLVRAVQQLQQSGLNAAQLEYVLGDTSAPEPNEARERVILSLREGLRAIAAELDEAAESDGALTRRALALLQVEPGLIDAALQVVLGADQAAAVLAQAPDPPPAIPHEWAERLRYSPQDRSLIVLGALSDGERATVKGFSADASYHAALDRLHAAPRATLQELAAALAAASVPFPDAAALLANTLFVADPAVREQHVRARLALILAAVLPPLRDRLSRTLVKQMIAALSLDASTVALLLEGERAPGIPIFPARDATQPLIADLLALATLDDSGAAAEAYELLVRLRLLIDALALKASDVRAFTTHLVTLRPTPHQLCSYADWETITAYARVRARSGQSEGRLAQLWEASTDAAAVAVLADVLGWPAETLAGLMKTLAFGVAEVQQIANAERLIAAGELVQALDVPPAQAAAWAREQADQAAASAVRNAVKAKYDEAAWLEVARTLSDTLRAARRAALVAYLLPRLGVKDVNRLYQLLLIDVEMSPCMQTSRIKQAISSVQLFTQRCLLNLEQLIAPQAIDTRHWKWMQNYRVWEANRKVLLYPENWILPELRDDKSPFFKELESALLQDDVTDPNVERALLGYLEKLDTVAKLDIIAIHVQEAFEPLEQLQTIVHIFGRTANPAHAYYYRRYVVTQNGTALWTPWEVVPVDIQGTLIAPVVFNRRLYLFWAVITTKTRQPPATSKSPQEQQYYQEIQLAWSEYRNGAWSQKQITAAQEALREDFTPGAAQTLTVQGVASGLDVIERLEARVENDSLRVLCITHRDILWTDDEKKISYSNKFTFDAASGNLITVDGNTGYTYAPGTFVLDSCHGRLVKVEQVDQTWRSSGLVFRLKDNALQAKPLAKKPLEARAVLARTTAPSQIVDAAWINEDSGYLVFSDPQRAYFAQFSRTSSLLHRIIEQPGLSTPFLEQPPKFGPSLVAGTAKATQLLKGLRVQAEVAQNSWASASAALATVAVTGASVPDERGMPQDSVLRKALQVESAGYSLALAHSMMQVRFEPLFHPFVCTYIKRLQQYGVAGVLTLANQQLTLAPAFASRYAPQAVVSKPYPVDTVDFGATEKPGIYRSSAYAIYNWELFFHAPMLIADRLSQNQRFEEAMRWFHYIFNPTDGSGSYWKVLPLQKAPKQTIEEWLKLLNAGDPDLQKQIAEWKDHPFEPHRIARMRLPAYQKYVVMRYLDNLIAWGDKLFERDTIESINQATQLYILAAELLGPRPERILPRGEPTAMSFAEMRGKLDALSNVAAAYENAFPALSSATMAGAHDTAGLLGISRSLYFCLPPNEKLLGYWDTVADRLFKLRNCMNLAGVVRQLPLFEPPIDPALLVRATAQGIDLSSVLSDLSAPLPHYRFFYILQKALDACADLKSLGAALLAALEKKDAELLAALRATHESTLLKATLAIRQQQEQEAAIQIEALARSREVSVERLRYQRWLMGSDDMAAPEVGVEIPMLPYGPKPKAAGGVFLIQEEQDELNASHSARDWQVRATFTEVIASAMSHIPNFSVVISPMGSGTSMSFGGSNLGAALSAIARYQAGLGYKDTYDATHAGKMASYLRRGQEYAAQTNAAAREIMQIDRQITVATIRKAIARLEREQIEIQIAQAELIEQHFKTKYTNSELYGWMQGQITAIYFQSYQLAYDLAKQAERCFRFERGVTSSNYIQFGVWDSLRKGLLAGEKLHLQLKQLERAYQDQHRRELELTKHVSLLQHAPLAFIRLKETGRCEIDLPELLYDMDYPGHHMRRIKSVSITIPAVVGPYSSVNATLTLLANETRISGALSGGKYERDRENQDARFVNDFAAIQAIATSSAQNDSGMFELSFRDERYLPFEGAGAASRWRIEIDPDCNRFDLASIADVVLQIRYTARDGGQQLRQKAKEHWKKLVADQESAPLTRLFSLRHEFPTEWYHLHTATEANGDHVQTIALTPNRFPLLFQRSTITIGRLDLFGVPRPGANPTKLPTLRTPQPDEAIVELGTGAPLKPLLHQTGTIQVVVKEAPEQARWQLSLKRDDVAASIDQLEDLLIVCHYSLKRA